jgi:hypothetical protein
VNATRTLTFVQEEIDLEALRRIRPDALQGDLVCFDPALHHVLLKKGLNHHVTSDFVTETERDRLYGLFDCLWRSWTHFLDPPLTYGGLDPFKLAPARHLCSFRRIAYSVLAIRRAMEELRPAQMIGFIENDVHGLEQPMGANRRMPLVQGLAQFEAHDRGIPYAGLDRRGVPGYVPWADMKATPAITTSPLPRRPFRRAAGKPFVLAAGNGRELIQQWPVVDELRRSGGAQVLHLALVMDPRTREELNRRGHVFHELADVDVPSPPIPFESIAREAALRRQRARGNLPSDARVLFDNPFIQSHFDFLLGPYLQRILVQIERWTRLLDVWRPDLVLVNWDLPAAGIARARGIPVLAMLHSMISPIDPVYLHWARSHLAVLTAGQVLRAVADGTPAHCVRATGHPDSDALFRAADESPAERDRRRTGLCRHLAIDPNRRLILLLPCYIESITSCMAWFPNTDMRRAIESWKRIVHMADRHPDWQLVVKGHPRADHLHVYRDIFGATIHGNVAVPDDMTLAEVAPACDVAVVCNATTSAQLETCFWKIPVVLLDDARCWLNPHARDEFSTWPRVASVADLERWLLQTGSDRDFWRQQQEATLRACDAFTGPRDGCAARRVADFAREIVASRMAAAPVGV